MTVPQSPFDDSPPEPDDPPSPKSKLPARKWSFITLGLVLFVLVWVRELTGMLPAATIALAVLILVGWAVLHIWLYAELPDALRERSPSAGRSGSELLTERRPQWARSMLLCGMVGVIVGVWVAHTIPLSPIALSMLVVLIYFLVGGAALVASRL